MITGYTIANKDKVESTKDLKTIIAAVKNDKTGIWVNVENPSESEYGILQNDFGFHPLTIDDIKNPRQRSKVDNYEGYSFITVRIWGEKRKPQLNLYIGKSFFVTVTNEPISGVDELIVRFEKTPSVILKGHDFVAHQVMDSALEQIFPAIRDIDDEIASIEARIFKGNEKLHLEKIFSIKKKLRMMKRILWPMRDVFMMLARGESAYVRAKNLPYFRDLHDHSLRLIELVDNAREASSAVTETQMTLASNNMNLIMKAFGAFAALIVVPTLIAGIYGMNFAKSYPAFDHPLGFEIAVGMMVLASVFLLLYFKRKEWI